MRWYVLGTNYFAGIGGWQGLSDDSGWPILAGLVLARVGMVLRLVSSGGWPRREALGRIRVAYLFGLNGWGPTHCLPKDMKLGFFEGSQLGEER
jgi:hypothetical protein